MGEDRTGEVKARDPTRGYPRGAHTGSFSKTIKKEGRHQAWNSQRVVHGDRARAGRALLQSLLSLPRNDMLE